MSVFMRMQQLMNKNTPSLSVSLSLFGSLFIVALLHVSPIDVKNDAASSAFVCAIVRRAVCVRVCV